jgi:hypothetical protein
VGFSERVERFVLWVAFLLIVPVYGFSFYNQISLSPSFDGRPFWFFCGALLTTIACLIKPPSLFWMVWAHETTHAFVAWLLGATLEKQDVDARRGGLVRYHFEKHMWGQDFISLAPYFFEPISLLVCGIIAIAMPSTHWWLSFIAGIGPGWFYYALGFTLQVPQTDISKTGRLFSFLVIAGMHILWLGTVLSVVFPKARVVGFWYDGPFMIWEHVSKMATHLL